MKHLKIMFIIGILILSIIVIGCSSKQAQNMAAQETSISQNTAPTTEQTPAASDEQDIQTSNDDFSQIDNALSSY